MDTPPSQEKNIFRNSEEISGIFTHLGKIIVGKGIPFIIVGRQFKQEPSVDFPFHTGQIGWELHALVLNELQSLKRCNAISLECISEHKVRLAGNRVGKLQRF